VGKWARRNRAAVWSGAAGVLVALAVLAGSIGWIVRDRAAREAALDWKVGGDMAQAYSLIEQAKWAEAEQTAERADQLLRAAGRTESPPRLRELRRDVAMARRLEDIYSQPVTQEFYTGKEEDAAYAQAFQDYGIDLSRLSVAEAAERIQGRSIRAELARALDFWSFVRRRAGTAGVPDWKQLLEVAAAADPDDWRNQLREAVRNDNQEMLKALAAAAHVCQLSPETLRLLGRSLADSAGALEQAVALLRQAQRQYPADLWINDALGMYCHDLRQYDDSARFYTAAQAVRPDSPYLSNGIGRALLEKRSFPEAAAEFAKAIDLKPDYAMAHNNLGIALGHQGKLAEAEAACREAIHLWPDLALLHFNLGWVLQCQGKPAEAEAEYREAIRLRPDYAGAHGDLGLMLKRQGKLTEAEAEYREALRLQPDYADARCKLGVVLERQGKLTEAEAILREGIRLQPDNPSAHNGLAWFLATCADPQRRNPQAAVALAERAVQLAPMEGIYWNTLGPARYRAGDCRGAITALEKSMALRQGGDSLDWFFLAMAHWQLGDKDQARQWYAKAVSWMEEHQPKDEALARFRAEAEELLGMNKK
jgi:superkiller protein 3